MVNKDYLPHTSLTRRIDVGINYIGKLVSYIWLVLLIVIVFNVSLRYLLNEGRIEFEELQWHLYAIGFLLGLSYAYQADSHIRVDVLHERLSHRAQAWIELYGILLFLLPFVALILIYSAPFVASSFALSEVSPSPGGLPLRWLIKASLPLGFSLLFLAVLSRFIRVWVFLFLQASPTPGVQHGSE
ncbi:MAG: TRAP transporter small permease subunit [Gammaproteobacteria bacterium]|nr:TRAP transporter small permease subunit [Gammaproteobacteria bacterium]